MDILKQMWFSFEDLKNAKDDLSDLHFTLDDYNNQRIGLNDTEYNEPVIYDNWSLKLDFDDRAFDVNEKVINIKLYLYENTTIKDILLFLKRQKIYGYFEGIEKIKYNRYEVRIGT